MMRQEGKRHSPVTFLSDCDWEQGLLVKGVGNIATCHSGLTLNLVRWEPDQETNLSENCLGKNNLGEAEDSPTNRKGGKC